MCLLMSILTHEQIWFFIYIYIYIYILYICVRLKIADYALSPVRSLGDTYNWQDKAPNTNRMSNWIVLTIVLSDQWVDCDLSDT